MTDTYYDQSYPPSLWAPAPPPAPVLTGINPTTGVSGASVALTVTGANFTPSSVVKFGTTSLATTHVSSSQLTANTGTLPAASTVQVSVSDPNGTSGTRPFVITAAQVEESPPAEEPVA